ncbi:hypothetical protein [Pseudomonas sp. zfem002]|uniref:hypothetical protein n=1 Tax=Pseudomonas sp. zfem002 TaxID=3078197 RepID=UPI00292910C4|nr:hypothetical protein [Pseudomonas sp. zfem002]MDU9392076.1 hypothetical protein [Pseudomonas sp. zfem002]
MKPIDLAPLLALCLVAATQADDSPLQGHDASSTFIYYGADQPFAHPFPPSLSSVAPKSYIPRAPQTFVPVASRHSFADSRLPTVTDTTARVFIRVYDAEHGVHVNEEVSDPACQLACLRH